MAIRRRSFRSRAPRARVIMGRLALSQTAQAVNTMVSTNLLTGIETARGYELAGATWLGCRGTFCWNGTTTTVGKVNVSIVQSNTSFVAATTQYSLLDRNLSDVMWWEELIEPQNAGAVIGEFWSGPGLYFRNVISKSRRVLRGTDQTVMFNVDNLGAAGSFVSWTAQFKFALRLP